MPEPSYGWRMDYVPAVWEGPVKVDHCPTNSFFAGIFRASLLIWLAIAVYAFYAQTGNEPVDTILVRHMNLVATGLIQDVKPVKSLWGVVHYALKYVALVAFMTVLFIIVLQRSAGYMVFTSILLVCIELIVACFLVTGLGVTHEEFALFPFLGLAILLAILGGFICWVMFSHKEIIIACEVIEEITRTINSFPSLFLLPIVQASLYLGSMAWAAYVFALITMIQSSGQLSFVKYILHLINVLGLIWFIRFVKVFGQMILAGSYATWFWTLDKRFVPNDTVSSVVQNTSRYHLGTLASGSLEFGIGRRVRAILELLPRIIRCGKECQGFQCCPSHYAYIMTAVHSTNLDSSRRDVFNLLTRNAKNVAFPRKVTYRIIQLGAFVLISVIFIATLFDSQFQKGGWVADKMFVYILFVVGSILMTECLFSFIRMAIDTAFLCTLEDYERNDGSDQKPYHASKNLQTLFLR